MYSTCLSCNANLGRNEVIEHFPVGRRLAFDAARGRLWVVCTSCRRWNLTPLEERWEAIEEAERQFRDTRLRISTGQIGLARVQEGLELVRVGEPQRPEMAAWRYGERFGRRRRRQLVAASSLALVAGAVAVGGFVTVVFAGGFGSMALTIWRGAEHGFPRTVVARLRADDGTSIILRHEDLSKSSLHVCTDGGLALRLLHEHGRAEVDGDEAVRVARRILPYINRRGGTAEDVRAAVERLERAGDSEHFLRNTLPHAERLTAAHQRGTAQILGGPEELVHSAGLLALSNTLGLAIEMALNEEQERRAMEGELAELDAAWREAEEIAAIADSMFLPEPVERAWRRLRGKEGTADSSDERSRHRS